MKERTLLLIKPDAVGRGLIGAITGRIEQKGLVVAALKLLTMTRAQAETLYAPHKGKGFYEPTVQYMTSGPIVAMVLRGFDVISEVRALMGATNPRDAAPGSIRGDFGQRVDRNCVHGSDSPESAQREIPIFFSGEELQDHSPVASQWI
ncbi:MAG: nucleoside-diphosphate kinase [Candidatus Eremiobacteraeota bacterium]|nr:nucleoside-diphosphate kinase [Candidatus Eremiobacteraeota bacterium]